MLWQGQASDDIELLLEVILEVKAVIGVIHLFRLISKLQHTVVAVFLLLAPFGRGCHRKQTYMEDLAIVLPFLTQSGSNLHFKDKTATFSYH